MKNLFFIPAALAAVTYFIKNLFHALHMLQLSSYKDERYLTWCKNNLNRLLKTALWVFIPGMLISFTVVVSVPLTYILLTALFIIAAVVYKLQPAKKPLAFTARIQRLMATSLIVDALLLTAGYFWSLGHLLVLLVAISAPMAALLANILNAPIEKLIYNHYFNEARKKVAEHKKLIVIGVTGSYGKTSTKFALGQILSVAFNTLVTPESYNTPMGITKVIRNQLSATHEVFVAEMGAGKVGDIVELCKLVDPDYGVICSVGPQHLETMGSMENIIKTKFSLADHVIAKGGTVFLNYDNEIIAGHPLNGDIVRYGTSSELDYWAEEIKADEKGTSFILCAAGKRYPCNTRLLGRYNVLNILAAVAVGSKLGIPMERMLPAVRRLEPVPHRLQLISRPNGLTIIDDAYNANPSGARMALETLSCFEGMRILITPGMVELGEREKELNKQMGAYAALHCDMIILVGGDRVLPIAAGAKEAGFNPQKILRCPTVQAALAEAESCISMHPVVLLENDLPDNYS